MKVYENFNINKSHRNSIILIGNFDGVHLGHRKLFNLAKKFSDKFKIKIGVLTFDPMPKIFFNKKLKILKFQISNRKKTY
jgi:riboflavin kinase/FMN adenylyltransferase